MFLNFEKTLNKKLIKIKPKIDFKLKIELFFIKKIDNNYIVILYIDNLKKILIYIDQVQIELNLKITRKLF